MSDPALTVVCPVCQAAPGEVCTDQRPTMLGTPVHPHRPRRLEAQAIDPPAPPLPPFPAPALVAAGRCLHRTDMDILAGLNPICPRCR